MFGLHSEGILLGGWAEKRLLVHLDPVGLRTQDEVTMRLTHRHHLGNLPEHFDPTEQMEDALIGLPLWTDRSGRQP